MSLTVTIHFMNAANPVEMYADKVIIRRGSATALSTDRVDVIQKIDVYYPGEHNTAVAINPQHVLAILVTDRYQKLQVEENGYSTTYTSVPNRPQDSR